MKNKRGFIWLWMISVILILSSCASALHSTEVKDIIESNTQTNTQTMVLFGPAELLSDEKKEVITTYSDQSGWAFLQIETVLWEDDSSLILYGVQNEDDQGKETSIYHILSFSFYDGAWKTEKDVYSMQSDMADVYDEAIEVSRDALLKARRKNPLEKKEVEKAKEITIKQEYEIMKDPYSMSHIEKRAFLSNTEVIYDASWENEELPKLLKWTYDYRKPAMLFYLLHHEEIEYGHSIYSINENDEWRIHLISGSEEPAPPARYENFPKVALDFGAETNLSDDKKTLIQRYIEAKILQPDPPSEMIVSKEVKGEWDYAEWGSRECQVHVIWDDAELMIVHSERRCQVEGRSGTRNNVISFELVDGEWTIKKDIVSDLWFMEDRSEEINALLQEAFRRSREIDPLRQEDIIAAEKAAWEREVQTIQNINSFNDEETTIQKESLEAIYDPDWEKENFYRVFGWQHDYRTKTVLIYVIHHDDNSGRSLYATLSEKGIWTSYYLGNRFEPEAPKR